MPQFYALVNQILSKIHQPVLCASERDFYAEIPDKDV